MSPCTSNVRCCLLETAAIVAGTLDVKISLLIGPESVDVTSIQLQPSALGKIAVADALAGNHSLPTG